jgi:hypothetical protein
VAHAALAADRRGQRAASMALLEAAFEWVRAENPEQPLTAGSWVAGSPMNARLYDLSDVISFHHYEDAASCEAMIDALSEHGRPLWCTEYLNRRVGCTFESHLPLLARKTAGAWNWGLVDGKTQTKYSWQDRGNIGEPEVWFHDIFRPDGTPYRDDEIMLIKAAHGR